MANINIPDSALFQAGAGPDLKLTHDGSNSTISNATGTLTINNIASASLILGTANTTAVTISNGQDTAFVGNIGVGSSTVSSPSSASRTLRIQHATGSASLVLCGDCDNETAWDILANTSGQLDIRKNNSSKLLIASAGQLNSNTAGISGWGATIHNAYNDASDVYVYLGYSNSSGRNSGMNISMDDATASEYLMSLNSNSVERFRITGAGQVKIAGSVANQLLYVEQDNTSNEAVRIYGPAATSSTIPILNVLTNNGADVELGLKVMQNGSVGIGIASPAATLHINTSANSPMIVESTHGDGGYIELQLSDSGGAGSLTGYIGDSQAIVSSGDAGDLAIRAQGDFVVSTGGGTERFKIDSSGNATFAGNVSLMGADSYARDLTFRYGTASVNHYWRMGYTATGNGNTLAFINRDGSAEQEVMRMDWNKNTTFAGYVGISTAVDTSIGLSVLSSIVGAKIITSSANANHEAMIVNRNATDGTLIAFQSESSDEGTIAVSGSTVAYNGFSGTHESSGIPTNTAIGTVVSTIDELDVYASGSKEGNTRATHAKIKVSDSSGDKRVYGVVQSFNKNDKPIIASVGIGSVKVTGACAGGDLLESRGDGTAKVQSDDIIKSKTIGKVTIGDSNADVKLVSCVLYCG